MSELDQVREAAARKRAAALEYSEAVYAARAKGFSGAQIAEVAGVTRQAILKLEAPETLLRQRMEAIEARWQEFVDVLTERFMPANARSEQAYRNVENGRARRQASGKTRSGRLSGSSGRKSVVRPTVRNEARACAEKHALELMRDNPEHPVILEVGKLLAESDRIRERLQSRADRRLDF